MGPQIETGSVFGRGFSTLFAHFGIFYGVSLAIHSPLILLSLVAGDVAPGSDLATLEELGSLLVPAILGPLATAVIIRGVYRHLRGQEVTLEETWRGVGSLWLPILGASILIGLAVILGYIACIVPGLIVQTGLFVALPVLVVERLGVTGSLSRSWSLTDGNRVRIFFVVVGLMLLALLGGGALGGAFGALGLGDTSIDVLTHLLAALITALEAVLAAVVYFDLRRLREGLDLDEVAAVFD